MKSNFKNYLAIGVTALSLSFAGCAKHQTADSADLKPIDPKNMDTTIKPGDDFFRYSNGHWMKTNPIPDEYSRWGAFNILAEDNNDRLKTIMEEAAQNPGADGSAAQKIGDFYKSGMDSAAIEKAGLNPIKKEMDMINSITDTKSLLTAIAHFHSHGMYPLFAVYSGQDEKNSEMIIGQLAQAGLGLGEVDYYTKNDAATKEIRAGYVKHVTTMFMNMNVAEADAKAIAEKILALETKLAQTSMTNEEMRDPMKTYNKQTLEGLAKMCPAIDWVQYTKDLGLANPGDFNVTSTKYYSGISKIITITPIETWKEYMRWNLINAMSDYLPQKFVDANFNFFSKTLSGKKKDLPRWKKVLQTTDAALGEAVGEIYVKKFFPPEAKARMMKLVENLRKAFDERLTNLSWMSPETKVKAKEKLASMKVKIGYPEKFRSYSDLKIKKGAGYAENVLLSSNFEFKHQMSKVGKPVDRAEWHMTPQTVNAYYSPNMNEIVFPAGILQPPFFFKDGDDAVNYGGIGAVIGHEMTHGFDDQGRLYDKNGNLQDWWTPADAENFTKQTSPLVAQFNKFMIDGSAINGKMTLGENIADLGGITVAHVALEKALKEKPMTEKIEGFTQEQRFLLSWSQVWRMNIRPEELKRRIIGDVHSPAEARVNGVMPNVPFFYKAFNVKEGDKLFRPEAERVVIW